MRTVGITELRRHASGLLSEVERGEALVVLRHGRPVAEIRPVARTTRRSPSWKAPALRLTARGAALSAAITQERRGADLP